MDETAAIDNFIATLIKEKFGQTELGTDILSQVTLDIQNRLNQYMTLRMISELASADPNTVEELHKLVLTNPEAKDVSAFINSHIKEPDVLVGQILSDFKSLYLGETQKESN